MTPATTTFLLLGLAGVHMPTSSALSTGDMATTIRQLPAPCGDFLVPCNLSYHNVATLGIMPREAMQATRTDMDLLQSLTANEYFGGGSVMNIPGPTFLQRMDTVRGHAASYLGCDLSETMLFPSTTTALNAVANGLVEGDLLKPGDHVLTTDQEHAGGIAGWVHYNKSGAIALDVVHLPLPDTRPVAEVVADFKAHMTPNTKVVAISHVTTTAGSTLPVKEIAAMAHEAGAVVVLDGAQALGMEVNVTDLGVDAYATSAHKWLLAPTGNGILCLRSSFQPHLSNTYLDGGVRVYTGSGGTTPAHSILGLGHSLDYIDSYGRAAVVNHSLSLAKMAWQAFGKIPEISTLAPCPDPSRPTTNAPIVSVTWTNQTKTSSDVAKAIFDTHGIVSKITGRKVFPLEWPVGAPDWALRFTFHMFNSEVDVAALAEAVSTAVSSP